MAHTEATRRRTRALLVDCTSGPARRQTTARLAARVPSTSGGWAACPRPPARSGRPDGARCVGHPRSAGNRGATRRSPLWTFPTRTSGAGPAASARNPEEFDTARYLLEAALTREEADVLRARKLALPATQPRMSLRCFSAYGRTSITGTSRPSSLLSEVTPASAIPHGTITWAQERSQQQLSAKPCIVTF